MNTQHDPPWAQAADPSAMGLDIHNLVDDDFADILNSDLFSTDLTDFNGLESTASTAQHPFGNALVQLSGHDGTKQPSGVLADVSEPIVTTTGSQEPAKTSVDPHEVFARNQYVHHGFVDLPQADHRLENGMLRTLPTPNSSEVYGKSLEYNSYPHMEPQQEQQGVQQRWPWSHTDVVSTLQHRRVLNTNFVLGTRTCTHHLSLLLLMVLRALYRMCQTTYPKGLLVSALSPLQL